SSDSLRKAKGQRGLEALKEAGQIMMRRPGAEPNSAPVPLVRVMNEIPLSVQSVETVDAKLVALAKEIGAAIVTNDFNLKPIAELQGVRVLNLNELTQSLKPIVLPGEEIDLLLRKEGNHPGQAVGYLDDGTMIVVSDGAGHVGEMCRVVITQLHQTISGKMFFADMKDKGDQKNNRRPGDDPFGEGPYNGPHHKKRR
ncbi:MAG TPA: TRAM domain-containing protein, partial [Abditibacteriaceae bacterium]